LERTLALPDVFFPCLDFHAQALDLAWKSGTPVYDMFYLALAIQRQATLATLDRRLRQICLAEGVPVVPN
jgi:predicted nucleic acid-binding protein